MTDEEKGKVRALIAKYEEYIEFLGKDSLFVAVHGGCPSGEFEKGVSLRREIANIKNDIN